MDAPAPKPPHPPNPTIASQPADESPPSLGALKRNSIRGGSITVLSQGVGMIVHIASTVVLARLLTPAEFGVIGMVLAVTAFAQLFRDLGLSSSTIQKQNLTHAQSSTIFWINVLAGTCLTAIVACLGPVIAWFYGRPELNAVTFWLSFTFVIGSLASQPSAWLARKLRFGLAAAANVIGAIAKLATTVYFASHGHSYWSIVYGTIAGSVVTAGMLLFLSGWWPGLPRRGQGLGAMLRYGFNLTAFDFVNYFSRNLDSVLIGKFAGADALGLYSRANNLLSLSTRSLRSPVATVAFSAMSRLQDRPEEFRNYYRSAVSVIALTSMPVVGCLFAVSHSLIPVVLGERWSPVAELFSILAFAAFLQGPSGFRGTALMSLGMGRRYFIQGLISAIVTSAGFIIGVAWGAIGVATAYAITSVAMTYPMHAYSFRGTPLRTADFLKAIAAPATASAGAAAAVVMVRHWILPPLAPVADVVVFASLYAAIYGAFVFLHKPTRRQLYGLVQLIRPKSTPSP